MLPFLKNKQQSVAGLIIKNRAPDKSNDSEGLDESPSSLESAAQSLIDAIHSKDVSKVVSALKEALSKIDEPAKDESAPSPHSYEAQNAAAAKESNQS